MSELHRFLHEARELVPAAVALRRRIHAKPELGLNLPLTTEAVLDALQGCEVEIARGPSTSGLVVSLSGTKPGGQTGRTILLRGDMDALPRPEETGLDFASEIKGRMHACGHDAHTAMLAQAVHLLHRHRDQFAGTVKFMFQPGEEGYGGARLMIKDGLLDADPKPDAAFALHIHPVVVTCAKVSAGTALNVIPETADMGGTVRATSEEARERAHDGIRRLAANIAAAHLCEADVAIRRGYPVTVNDAGFVDFARGVASDLLGADNYIDSPAPLMGAEDFSYVLQRMPGCMMFLGVMPAGHEGHDYIAPCHSNRMMLNEDCMAVGIAMHAAIAHEFLAR